MSETYDIAIVGAGIVGLAHALAAARRGKRVVVVDRDACANGASVRNFGFITVSGQEAGDCHQMARRACAIWQEVAEAARIPILQRGLVVAARYDESEAVGDAFLATEMGEGCRKISAEEARTLVPPLSDAMRFALHSPHEIRVESKTAIGQVTDWLAERHGVAFRFGEAPTGRIQPQGQNRPLDAIAQDSTGFLNAVLLGEMLTSHEEGWNVGRIVCHEATKELEASLLVAFLLVFHCQGVTQELIRWIVR